MEEKQNARTPKADTKTPDSDRNMPKSNAKAPDSGIRAPELNAKAPETRVEPQNIDPEKVLAYAERRAARRVRDEELAALASLALIRGGMIGGQRDRLREDFDRPRDITNEEWRQRLQRIIEDAEQ